MSYSRHAAYRQANATSWTRIDMLIALYDGTQFAVEQGRAAAAAADEDALRSHRHRSQRLLTELLAGVDREQGELAENTYRLLMFCLMQICGNSEAEWSSTVTVISELREAFRSIRDEAVQLERDGQIPRLDMAAAESLAVG